MADEIENFDWIPTGLPNLDAITGGGIPTKKITEVSGPFSVGKTTLALTTVAEAQKLGYKALWCDLEWSFDQDYPRALGVKLEALGLIQERFAEAAVDLVEEWAEKHKKAIIVIDAIGAMTPREEVEKGSEGRVIGGQARIVARFCRKIVPLLVLNNIALIVLNHEFTDVMSGRIMTSGGKKLEHAKSIWLKLRKMSKKVMQGDTQIGEIIEAEIRKNKVVGSDRKTTELMLLYAGQGFSKEADKLDKMLESGEISKQGNTFYHGEVKIGVGMAKARAYVKSLSDKED